MSKRYELVLKILDPRYVDRLCVALIRQGYDVYYNDRDGEVPVVCFTVDDADLTALGGAGIDTGLSRIADDD